MPNSRSMRFSVTSRWSSPIPERSDWPVSASTEARSVGSSRWSRGISSARRSRSALVFGSIAIETTVDGSGSARAGPACLGAQRVAADRRVQAGDRDDVARLDRFDRLAAVGVHAQHAPQPLALARARVPGPLPGLEASGVDADVEEIGGGRRLDLEHERRERRAVRRLAHDLRAVRRDRCRAPRATSSGDGRYQQTASSSGWMPTLRSAAPQSTGTAGPATVTARKAARRSAAAIGFSARNRSASGS